MGGVAGSHVLVREQIKARLKEFDEEERELSYRQRVLQGRIDLIRADLLLRGGVTLSPEGFAPVLLGGESNQFGHVEGEGGI